MFKVAKVEKTALKWCLTDIFFLPALCNLHFPIQAAWLPFTSYSPDKLRMYLICLQNHDRKWPPFNYLGRRKLIGIELTFGEVFRKHSGSICLFFCFVLLCCSCVNSYLECTRTYFLKNTLKSNLANIWKKKTCMMKIYLVFFCLNV